MGNGTLAPKIFNFWGSTNVTGDLEVLDTLMTMKVLPVGFTNHTYKFDKNSHSVGFLRTIQLKR